MRKGKYRRHQKHKVSRQRISHVDANGKLTDVVPNHVVGIMPDGDTVTIPLTIVADMVAITQRVLHQNFIQTDREHRAFDTLNSLSDKFQLGFHAEIKTLPRLMTEKEKARLLKE